MKTISAPIQRFFEVNPGLGRSGYLLSRLLYEFTPAAVHAAFIRTIGRAWESFCPVCEQPVPSFAPLPDFYSRALAEHGSDLRICDFETCNFEAYQCPHCGASDRDRLYALYLASRLPSSERERAHFRLLDIAPSAPLSGRIRRNYPIQYRTADRFMRHVDDRVDITAMDCYADATFDAFICSHVLEHVENDRKAMAELWRILKPGGWGIAMAPINLVLPEIREDPARTSLSERWKHFGQGDHVRVYTRSGFVHRLEEAGFVVVQVERDQFETRQMARCGLSLSSVLYVVEKTKEKPNL